MSKQTNTVAGAVWNWVISIFIAVALLSCAAKVSAMTIPIHTQNTSYDFMNDGVGFYNLDTHITWHKEPDTDQWGYYAMKWFMFQAGTGGYTGLQKAPGTINAKKAIFSIWDVPGKQTAYPVAGTGCNRFGHEGTGTQCIINFDWKAGVEYKLRVWRLLNSSTGQSEKWGGWVINVATGEETLIGMIELFNANNLIGYGNLATQGHNTVLEFWAAPQGASCADMPYFGVTWKGPYANNGKVNPTLSTASYVTGVGNENCPNVNAISNAPFSVTQESGKAVVKGNTHGTRMWGYYNKQNFDQIDCLFNWAETTYPDIFKQTGRKQRALSNSVFNLYYRDYKVGGKGSSLVVDTISNKVIKSDTGGANTVVGELAELKRAANCQY